MLEFILVDLVVMLSRTFTKNTSNKSDTENIQNIPESIYKIKLQIGNNEIVQAIDEIFKIVSQDKELQRSVILLKSQFNSLKQEKIINTISFDEYNRRLTQIASGLLHIIDDYSNYSK